MIKERARGLRRNQTEAEKWLWCRLRNRQLGGFRFYRQYPVPPYYADFACRDLDLIVEVDGGQHNDNAEDERRTKYLEEKGYKVVRFWNNDVLRNTDGVLMKIEEMLLALTPTLSLKGEGADQCETENESMTDD